MRWELRTRPFLRSAEFLWQEGHTAHATEAEADATAREMLDVYAGVIERELAVPVVRGVKSPSERFAGADETYTVEALMQNGCARARRNRRDAGATLTPRARACVTRALAQVGAPERHVALPRPELCARVRRVLPGG